MSFPTPVGSPSVSPISGVFDADPIDPPAPPLDARAIEIRDATGRVIAYAWVIRDHADDRLKRTAYSWLDEHDVTPLSGRPRLVP